MIKLSGYKLKGPAQISDAFSNLAAQSGLGAEAATYIKSLVASDEKAAALLQQTGAPNALAEVQQINLDYRNRKAVGVFQIYAGPEQRDIAQPCEQGQIEFSGRHWYWLLNRDYPEGYEGVALEAGTDMVERFEAWLVAYGGPLFVGGVRA